MANSDDFYYDYKPKHEADDVDLASEDIFGNQGSDERDISSYSKTDVSRSSAVKIAPTRAPRKRTAPAASSKSAPKSSHKSTASKITSVSKDAGKLINSVYDTYGNFCFRALGNIIKVISFIVAFGLIIVSLVLAFTIFKAKAGLSLISLLIIIGGTVIAAMLFFPIYGIGHIICQNNEILRIFNDK